VAAVEVQPDDGEVLALLQRLVTYTPSSAAGTDDNPSPRRVGTGMSYFHIAETESAAARAFTNDQREWVARAMGCPNETELR
jgi:hypothetical protein